jgi:hypothetical protein
MASNATLAGAIKYVIESAGLGVSAYRDLAPPKASMPFCVITEGVAWNVLPHGDTDASDELSIRELVQVDIYQGLRSADGTRIENPDLEDLVCFTLQQSKLPTWVNLVYGVQVLTRSTQTDQAQSNVRRTIVTLQIDRLLAAPAIRERIRK